MATADSALTPGRHTSVLFDPGDYVLAAEPVNVHRRGAQIAKLSYSPFLQSQHVELQPGDAWTLTPRDLKVHSVDSGNAVTAGNVLMASGWKQTNTFRASDLTGVGTDPSVIPSGSPAFTRDVSATTDVSTQGLFADQSAFPQPTLPSQDVPVDRVIVGTQTYPENAGWALEFSVPGDFATQDNLMVFYWGGPTESGSAGFSGGAYALNIRGNGEARLYERVQPSNTWGYRMSFPWMNGQRVGNVQFYVIKIIPYGQDSIVFRTLEADGVVGDGQGFGLFGLLTTIAGLSVASQNTRKGFAYYKSGWVQSGYVPGPYVTGRGNFRLDVRRDLRSLIQIRLLQPQYSGTLVDAPFFIRFPIPGGTLLKLTLDAYMPKNSSIVGTLCDAASGTALAGGGTDGLGTLWLSNATQQNYFVKFDLFPDHATAGGSVLGSGSPPGNGEQTPVLFGFNVDVIGTLYHRAPGQLTGGQVRQVGITGPDLDPSHDTARMTLLDVKDELADKLQTIGRIHSQILIKDDAGALTSILFEGETAKAVALKRGPKTAGGYTPSLYRPASEWRRYDILFTGMWSRLADYVNIDGARYDQGGPVGSLPSPASPPEFPRPGMLPWKVTDVIVDLLRRAGFADAQIDVPDLPIRLGSSFTDKSEFLLQPQQDIAALILKLCRGYLGSVLIWAPNAGQVGRWRLLPNPQPPYTNILASFVGYPDKVIGGAPKATWNQKAYLGRSTFIIRGSYRDWVEPPEANIVMVTTLAAQLGGSNGPSQIPMIMYNVASADFPGKPPGDRTSPDWLGRYVKILHVLPWTASNPQRAAADVAFAARRIYDFACHGRRWLQFQAPLLLVQDTDVTQEVRERPLRINDLVTVYGKTCMVRSCNPIYVHDRAQRAEYECVALN